MPTFKKDKEKEAPRETLEKKQEINKKRFYIFYDLETTGINPLVAQILDFAAVVWDHEEQKIIETKRFSLAWRGDTIPEVDAVAVNGLNPLRREGMSELEAAQSICAFFSSYPKGNSVLSGYNTSAFDNFFLFSLLKRNLPVEIDSFMPEFKEDVFLLVSRMYNENHLDKYSLYTKSEIALRRAREKKGLSLFRKDLFDDSELVDKQGASLDDPSASLKLEALCLSLGIIDELGNNKIVLQGESFEAGDGVTIFHDALFDVLGTIKLWLILGAPPADENKFLLSRQLEMIKEDLQPLDLLCIQVPGRKEIVSKYYIYLDNVKKSHPAIDALSIFDNILKKADSAKETLEGEWKKVAGKIHAVLKICEPQDRSQAIEPISSHQLISIGALSQHGFLEAPFRYLEACHDQEASKLYGWKRDALHFERKLSDHYSKTRAHFTLNQGVTKLFKKRGQQNSTMEETLVKPDEYFTENLSKMIDMFSAFSAIEYRPTAAINCLPDDSASYIESPSNRSFIATGVKKIGNIRHLLGAHVPHLSQTAQNEEDLLSDSSVPHNPSAAPLTTESKLREQEEQHGTVASCQEETLEATEGNLLHRDNGIFISPRLIMVAELFQKSVAKHVITSGMELFHRPSVTDCAWIGPEDFPQLSLVPRKKRIKASGNILETFDGLSLYDWEREFFDFNSLRRFLQSMDIKKQNDFVAAYCMRKDERYQEWMKLAMEASSYIDKLSALSKEKETKTDLIKPLLSIDVKSQSLHALINTLKTVITKMEEETSAQERKSLEPKGFLPNVGATKDSFSNNKDLSSFLSSCAGETKGRERERRVVIAQALRNQKSEDFNELVRLRPSRVFYYGPRYAVNLSRLLSDFRIHNLHDGPLALEKLTARGFFTGRQTQSNIYLKNSHNKSNDIQRELAREAGAYNAGGARKIQEKYDSLSLTCDGVKTYMRGFSHGQSGEIEVDLLYSYVYELNDKGYFKAPPNKDFLEDLASKLDISPALAKLISQGFVPQAFNLRRSLIQKRTQEKINEIMDSLGIESSDHPSLKGLQSFMSSLRNSDNEFIIHNQLMQE